MESTKAKYTRLVAASLGVVVCVIVMVYCLVLLARLPARAVLEAAAMIAVVCLVLAGLRQLRSSWRVRESHKQRAKASMQLRELIQYRVARLIHEAPRRQGRQEEEESERVLH